MKWIGVDLDATLAEYEGWQGPSHIGPPVPAMLKRVRHWLEHGHPRYGPVEVRIVTARASERDTAARMLFFAAMNAWCLEHVGRKLKITNEKDYAMVELYDDRAITVEANTGRIFSVETGTWAVEEAGPP